jgi:hypothetical protein
MSTWKKTARTMALFTRLMLDLETEYGTLQPQVFCIHQLLQGAMSTLAPMKLTLTVRSMMAGFMHLTLLAELSYEVLELEPMQAL